MLPVVVVFISQFAQGWFAKGRALYGLERYQEGIACCDKALRIDPQLTYAHYIKGRMLYAQQQYKKALADFDDMQLNPQARELLARAIASDPTNEFAVMGLEEMNRSNHW